MKWSAILKDAGDEYDSEISHIIEDMASLQEENSKLMAEAYELAEENEDEELIEMLLKSSEIMEIYLDSQMGIIKKLQQRQAWR